MKNFKPFSDPTDAELTISLCVSILIVVAAFFLVATLFTGCSARIIVETDEAALHNDHQIVGSRFPSSPSTLTEVVRALTAVTPSPTPTPLPEFPKPTLPTT